MLYDQNARNLLDPRNMNRNITQADLEKTYNDIIRDNPILCKYAETFLPWRDRAMRYVREHQAMNNGKLTVLQVVGIIIRSLAKSCI